MPIKEEQLDLFGEPMAEQCGQSPSTRHSAPAPCPWCIRLADLVSLQIETGGQQSLVGEPDCQRCAGTGKIDIKVRVAEGFWWDSDRLQVIEAASVGNASRKMGKGAEPAPLYVDFGGYNP